MLPLISLARVGAVVAVLLGSSCVLVLNNETGSDQPLRRSIDVERKGEHLNRIDVVVDEGRAQAGNPDESSFGTLQEDGTYCGVFCAEDH